MLYDSQNMNPLFQLEIGKPGSSFAFEIARKIGLPEDVIAQASEIVGNDYINMDKYLQDISRDRRYWERKRDEIRRDSKRLEQITAKYEADIEDINRQRRELLSEAKMEAEKLFAESNAKIENTIRQIRESQADKEKTRQLRKSLDEYKDSVKSKDTTSLDKRSKSSRKTKQTSLSKPKNEVATFDVGDTVRMKGQTVVGEIIEVSEKKASVAFGMIKSTVDISRLEHVSNNQLKRESQSSNMRDIMHGRKLDFKQEIDVRGMRGDEALQAVMYYVDDAIQLGVSRVRILHGTGTGALREIIRDYLRVTHGVSKFMDEHVQFGGAGITVVDFE